MEWIEWIVKELDGVVNYGIGMEWIEWIIKKWDVVVNMGLEWNE